MMNTFDTYISSRTGHIIQSNGLNHHCFYLPPPGIWNGTKYDPEVHQLFGIKLSAHIHITIANNQHRTYAQSQPIANNTSPRHPPNCSSAAC